MSGSIGRLVWHNISGSAIVLTTLALLPASALLKPHEAAFAAGTANDGPGIAASWTTGNKVAVGTSADETGKVWFTVANGITTEVFYPRLDIPNMQDMQYIVTDGSTFVDLERDATTHEISMPDEKALEYTVANTDKRATPKYRITNTYITDPSNNTLLIRTRFQSLDGNSYQLYLLENASMAGGGANNNAWWDQTSSALIVQRDRNADDSRLSAKGGEPERLRRTRKRLLGSGERLLRRAARGESAHQPVRQRRH